MTIGRISDLIRISNETCFEMIRENRWPDGTVRCLHCSSENIKKNGHDKVQVECQHYYCTSCKRYFDDLTNTVFSGLHRPLKAWIACLYLMGLNVSNSEIAQRQWFYYGLGFNCLFGAGNNKLIGLDYIGLNYIGLAGQKRGSDSMTRS